ncbi:MAG: MFS transporter [Gammaproteobacteria bacterium]|nr:MFS transporter [Gammaproteobacteria bacterium]
MNDHRQESRLQRAIRAATKVEPNELKATALSFLWVFLVMSAWYILRPVRDALSSDWTDEQLSWLWTSTFFFSAIAVSIYGAVISRVRFNRIVPGVYLFFALSFVGFYIAGATLSGNDIVNRIYYVWTSVFGLFHLSVFWTFMSGLYNKKQAERLFGVIAVGATTGAIAGPAFVSAFADDIGSLNMLIVSAVLLLTPLPIMAALSKLRTSALGNPDLSGDLLRGNHLGVNPFSGFAQFVRNPYLLWIGLFILLYVCMSTFLYYEIRKPLGDLAQVRRSQIWANIDLAVNSLAAVTALFATSRLTMRLGMPKTLAFVPALMVVAWTVVAANPAALTVFVVQVVRRAGNYAITRPAREMLFTLVDSETRYKAKPVIDTVVYRGGDVVTAWFYTALTTTAGLGLVGIATVGAVIAALWALVGRFLGKIYVQESSNKQEEAQ